jgi:hypothetical protein
VSLFCRHNRLTANCPICSRELQSELKAKAPPSSRPRTSSGGAKSSRPRSGMVTRRMERAADDGYRNPLTPGLRATADAERLAAALTAAAARLEAPGPYPEIATEPDREEATWLAFLLALAGPDAPELQQALLAAHPAWGDGALDDLSGDRRGLPRMGRPRRLAGRRVRGRRALDAGAALRPRLRAARAAGLRPRPPLRPADRTRRRRPLRADRGQAPRRQGGRRHHAGGQAAAGLR